MPVSLGAHNSRIASARELLSKKGRREQGRFSFEGATLLAEALAAGVPVQELFANAAAYEGESAVRECEAQGIPVYLIDDRALRRISDLETPPGVVAVAPIRLHDARRLFEEPGLVLILADVSDPGNAGALLRTAEAFGVRRVVFGPAGAEPYLPKVVRSAMGGVFRQQIAVEGPAGLRDALDGWEVTGLDASGPSLSGLSWGERTALVVGSERGGLGCWGALCTRRGGIRMAGGAESLNAATAGAIALYEATGRRNP